LEATPADHRSTLAIRANCAEVLPAIVKVLASAV
jgi:hypothetical protein